MNFKLEILANFEFLGYQICRQTGHKVTKLHLHLQLKSRERTSFSKQLVWRSHKNFQPTKINQIVPFIMDFIPSGKD